MNKKPIFIAEIKTQSPFVYKSDFPFHSSMEKAVRFGDWISVHTNPLWGGSFEAIEYVRKFTNKPILAKGIHSKDDDIKKALDYGADKVLVVDRFPANLFRANPDKLLIEISNFDDFEKYSYDLVQYGQIVYNGRNLLNGLPKKLNEYPKYREKCNGFVAQAI